MGFPSEWGGYRSNHRPARHIVECGGTPIHQEYVMSEKCNINHRPAWHIVECGGTQIHQKYVMNMSEKYKINYRPARHIVECGRTQIHHLCELMLNCLIVKCLTLYLIPNFFFFLFIYNLFFSFFIFDGKSHDIFQISDNTMFEW